MTQLGILLTMVSVAVILYGLVVYAEVKAEQSEEDHQNHFLSAEEWLLKIYAVLQNYGDGTTPIILRITQGGFSQSYVLNPPQKNERH